jgi:hypothetical protein
MRIFVEMIPEREEDAWIIGTKLANNLALKLAPTHWKNYRKDHGTLKEFLVAHPEVREGGVALVHGDSRQVQGMIEHGGLAVGLLAV